MRVLHGLPAISAARPLIIGAWLLTLAVNAPGQLSSDSIYQINEGVTGIYASMHPPLMSALLGLLHNIFSGTGLYLLVASAPFFGALLAIAEPHRPRLVPLTLLGLLLISPMVLIYQGTVWKDVLFANFSSAAFASIAVAHDRTRSSGRPRCTLTSMVVAAISAGVAIMVRQNGLVILPFLGGASGFLVDERGRRLRTALAAISVPAGAIGCALMMSAVISATAVSQVDTIAVGLRSLERFDIAGIAAARPEAGLDLPDFANERDRNYLRDLRQKYSPERVDTLDTVSDPVPYNATGNQHMEALWRGLVLRYTGAFIAHRLAFARWLFFPPEAGRCLPFYVGVNGPQQLIERLHLERGMRPGDQALFDYGKWFLGTPLYWNGAWVFATLIATMWLSRNFRANFPIVLLLLAAIGFAASFLIIGIACDVRYCYLVPVSVAIAIARLTRPDAGLNTSACHAAAVLRSS